MKVHMITPADLPEMIQKLHRSGGKIDQETHDIVVSSLYAAKEGELSYCTMLILALGKSMAKTQLLTYMKAHSPLVWKKKQGEFMLKREKNQNPWLLEEAAKLPFWDYELPPQPKQPFDAVRVVTKLRKQIEQAIAVGEFGVQQQKALAGGLAGIMVDYTEMGGKTAAEVSTKVGSSVTLPV